MGLSLLGLAVLLLLTACGDDDTAEPTDASTRLDTGSEPSTDAGEVSLVGTWVMVDRRCEAASIGLEPGTDETVLVLSPDDTYTQTTVDPDCSLTGSGAWSATPPNRIHYTVDFTACDPEGCLFGSSTDPCTSGPRDPGDGLNGGYSHIGQRLVLHFPGTGSPCMLGGTLSLVYDRRDE